MPEEITTLIEKKKKELQETALGTIRKLEEITTVEKVRVFDELFKMAGGDITSVIKENEHLKDIELYIYEAVMEKCLGRNIFDLINIFII